MKPYAEERYQRFQSMMSQTEASLEALSGICGELGMDNCVETLKDVRLRLQSRVFTIGVVGEFKRGKSTLVNALLGKDILPASVVPTTAAPNRICWGDKPGVTLRYKDGQEQEIEVDELRLYVTRLTPEAEKIADTVDEAEVRYPCRLCRNGVQLIETPGLNDSEQQNRRTEELIPMFDAIIMVLVPESPLSQSEAEFIRTKLMTSDLGRLLFVVNRVDSVRKESRLRLLEIIRNRIRRGVLERIAAIYGKDSEEYSNATGKIGLIQLYGVSALEALQGRMSGDEELTRRSGILEFEAALARMLTDERGTLDLIVPINTLLSIGREALKAIGMKRRAAQLSTEEMLRITAEGKAAVKQARWQKKETLKSLRYKADTVFWLLQPELDYAYHQAESMLLAQVDAFTIPPTAVHNRHAMTQLADRLEETLSKSLQELFTDLTEKLLEQIKRKLGRDVAEIGEHAEELRIELSVFEPVPNSSDSSFSWGAAAFDAVTNCIGVVGLGGILTGWKEGGTEGGLIGGSAGFLAGQGAYQLLLAAVGGAVGTGILPVAVISGIVSAFAGRAAVRVVFRNQIAWQNITSFRSQLRTHVQNGVMNLQSQRIFEKWLRSEINMIYQSVEKELDRELEQVLSVYESTLSSLGQECWKSNRERAATLAQLDRCEEQLNWIAETVRPIKEELIGAIKAVEA